MRGGERAGKPLERLFARGPMGDDLGDHRIVEGRDLVAFARRRNRRARLPRSGARCATSLPGRRQEALLRVFGIEPRLDRMAVDRELAPASSGSGSPAATRICHSTRSSPVIASVTGCSTCRRVFISMK